MLGKDGQVGWELRRTLAPLGEVVAWGRLELDLSDVSAIRRRVREIQPDVLVNAAAYTQVDVAEEEVELALAINATAPGVLAEEAARLNVWLVHFSTDFVFDGQSGTPYTEDTEARPINVYGSTKLQGERAIEAVGGCHLILRTSWVYGLSGRNFLLTMLRLARERDEIRVVDDQVGTPTWSRWLAEMTAHVLASVLHGHLSIEESRGLFHVSAAGSTTWYGFAAEILRMANQRIDELDLTSHLIPIGTAEYPTPARRPPHSVLATRRLQEVFELSVSSWEEQLDQCLDSVEIARGRLW